MAHYQQKKIYEAMMGEHLPPGYNRSTFTAHAYGKTIQGFKPYRAKRNPDGSLDVRTTGKNGFVLVKLDGREVWASLPRRGDTVTLLGWGNCTAYMANFEPEERGRAGTT